MSVQMIQLGSREEWLEHRKQYIGGSDASAILGAHYTLSNVDLWEIKTGRKKQKDISQEPFVKYGTEAEQYLRELFRLDFPEFKVEYIENNSWTNDLYPWAAVSLDGWLTDQDGRKGVWECKTTNILRAGQKNEWDDRIPSGYYIQLLHELMVTGFDYAIMAAQLRYRAGVEMYKVTKHYRIERSEVEPDIDYLINAERRFWDSVEHDKRPALQLPEL